MVDSEPCCILDASVLFDLAAGDILLEFQNLPFGVGIPDVIVEQEVIQEPAKTELSKVVYEKIHFEAHHYDLVINLRRENPSTSIPDLFAYAAAQEREAVLITGDKNLRRLAENEGLEVHGVLWVLDELVRSGIIIPLRAAKALRDILAEESFLPQDECEKRFLRWKRPDYEKRDKNSDK